MGHPRPEVMDRKRQAPAMYAGACEAGGAPRSAESRRVVAVAAGERVRDWY